MGKIFVLESARRQSGQELVTIDGATWDAIVQLARDGGHPVHHEAAIPAVDAARLAVVLRAGEKSLDQEHEISLRGSRRWTAARDWPRAALKTEHGRRKLHAVIQLAAAGGILITSRERA